MDLLGGRGDPDGRGQVYDTMHLETLEERRRRYVSFWLVCARTSCAYISLSMIVPTTWPYMQNLDPQARKTDAAWIISGMFIARIVNNALLGPALRVMTLRTLALGTSVMVMVSYVMWALAYMVPGHHFYLLAASRAVDGLFGSDTVIGSVFVTRGTTARERGPAMALLAGAAAAAYIPGAGATTLLSFLGSDGVLVAGFRLNMYTLAAITAFVIYFVTTILLALFFFDNEIAYQELELGLGGGGGGGGLGSKRKTTAAVNYVGIATCIVVMCAVGCILLFNDSLLVPMFMDMNGWPEETAVRTYGFLMMGFSLVSTIMFVVTARLANRFGERVLLVAGSAAGLIGFFVSLPWGSEMPPAATPLANLSTETFAAEGNISMAGTDGTISLSLGCPPEQTWCAHVPRIYLGQFVAELALHGVAVALLASMSNALFSRCLTPGSEGFWWGLMKAMANVSRLVTPVAFSYLYQYAGPRAMYGTLTSVLAGVLAVVVVCYRRLTVRAARRDEETPLLADQSRSRRVSGSESPCVTRSEYGSSDTAELNQIPPQSDDDDDDDDDEK